MVVLFLPIVKRNVVAVDTLEISFGLLGQKFDFVAGEYMRVTVFPKLADEKGDSRDFSIASSPNDKEKLSIVFRSSDSVFKKTLGDASIGTMVKIEGPFGRFVLPESIDKPLIFIAGGVGIAPFMSIINFVSENKLSYKIQLLYFNRDVGSGAFLDKLALIKIPDIVVKNIFGIVRPASISENAIDMLSSLIYIAGPDKMVYETRKIVMNLGVQEENILTEEFTGY